MKNMINIENSHVVLTEVLNKEIVAETARLDMVNWLLSNSNVKETQRISYQNKQAYHEFRLQILKDLKQQTIEATE